MRVLFCALALAVAAPAVAQTPPHPQPPQYHLPLREAAERAQKAKEDTIALRIRLRELAAEILHYKEDALIAVVHSDELGASFAMQRVQYRLDGHVIYDSRGGPVPEALAVLQESVAPGLHSLEIMMEVRGAHPVFDYTRGYAFRLKKTVPLYATRGSTARVVVAGYQQGNPLTTEMEDKPSMKVSVTVRANGQ